MAKDDKKNAKDAKNAQPSANKDKEAPKNDWKEQTKPDGGGTAPNNSGCSSFAKVLIYLIPLALYVPWAYRMFKGNACCSEVPKCPTASMSQGCPASGGTSFTAPLSKLGQRLTAPKDYQSSCSESQSDVGDTQYCDGGKGKAVDIDKEREECLEKSKSCLEKCMEKCFDADKVDKEKKKRKKRKERKCEEDEDD